ncbi:MAG: substrate-binding domain-containing protein [Chloroflexi bacterium]|nr:substrate-binding domain-containing protein [Chloroflexota bacterium]
MADDKGLLKNEHAKSQNRRQTIGLLLGSTGHSTAWDVWSGVDQVTRKHNVNLLCVAGEALRSHFAYTAQANVLYDLLNAENVDGLVIWGGGLGQHVDIETMETFCQQYHPLPMVNAALPMESIPSVLLDNYQGMREMIVHLVEIHGYQRIAFVCGPEGHREADARYRAYVDVLAEYGLAFDPNLVAPGDFNPRTGVEAVRLLFDQRKLQPGTDVEVIAFVGDSEALVAIDALQARGIDVPGDLAVTGFDNVEEGWYSAPSLTTVPVSAYEQARRATEMLMMRLEGERIPQRIMMPTWIVVRQSCGCSTLMETQVVQQATKANTGDPFDAALADRWGDILSEMVRAVEATSIGIVAEGIESLLDAFLADVKKESAGAFLSELERIVQRGVEVGSSVNVWQGALSVLRRHVLPHLSDREMISYAEDLWHQARLLIGWTAEQVQAQRRIQMLEQSVILNEINQTLVTTFDVTELMNVTVDELPRISVEGAYFSLYEDPKAPTEWSRLIMAYNREGRIALEPNGRRFPSHQLVPDDLLLGSERYSMVLEALYFQKDPLGFALFEADPRKATIYDTIRGHISSALKGALLLQERKQATQALEKAYAEVEKRVQERTAELEREIVERVRAEEALQESNRRLERTLAELQSTQKQMMQQERLAAVGQLAAGIAHDFNNIMAAIVLYAEMTMRFEDVPAQVRERMVVINQQAQHATQLIQQILDFSRRAVLERQPLDMSSLLKEQIKLLKRTLPENIEIDLTSGPDEYIINADPTRMRQIMTNLAVNARDAMLDGGKLHTELRRIEVRPGESPLLPEMETGEWIKLSVSDTGAGIPPDVLPYIFEPFFTTKAPSAGSGLGLAQIYGIVAQHQGRINVDTQIGQGTTFTIYFPALSVIEEPVTDVEPSWLDLPEGQGECILVVEDEMVVRQALAESLESLNYQVLEAKNGQEALAIVKERDDISLVLSDVIMPEMGGIALLDALSQKGLAVPVVLLSGHPLEREQKALRVKGLRDWLLKPPSLERLAQSIAKALSEE